MAAVCIAMYMVGCIGTRPEERDPLLIGDYYDGDEEHRPGQPCLLCHGADGLINVPEFAVAGTVYDRIEADEDSGIEGAEVHITDAAGRSFSARTNSVGNFMVAVDGDVSAPVQRERGWLDVPFSPRYPLFVRITYQDVEQVMETPIWRSGSCATCHRDTVDVDSVGRVYLFAEEAGP